MIKFALFALIILVFSYFSGCSVDNPTEINQVSQNPDNLFNAADANRDWNSPQSIELGQESLEQIAIGLVKLFSEEKNSEILENELQNSPYVNNIIDVRLFFKKYNFTSLLAEKSGKSEDIINFYLSKLPPDLSLYFYYKQRGLWKKGDNLLVAYPDIRKSMEQLKFIPAVDKNGNKYYLGLEGVPEIPTLIFTISEHGSNRPLKFEDPIVHPADSLYNPPGGGAGGQSKTFSVEYTYIMDDHECDILEPPEFYVKMQSSLNPCTNRSITPPVDNTSPHTYYK
jgi:hypothetical protein